jgi:hypothetical protein
VLRRVFLVLILAMIAMTACSDNGGSDALAAPERDRTEASILPPATQDDPQQEAEAPPEENPDDGRLVVQDEQGQLTTMLPDGSDVVGLTDPGTRNSQASWAPDGSRLAWVAVDGATGEASIASDRYDRSDFRSIGVDTAPFYLYWDPSASRIAHLGPSPGGIDLSVAELFAEDGPTNRRVDRGEPFFLSWGPDGDELLVHASTFRLDRIDLGSATVIVDEFPADFGAPAWLEDDSMVFADIEDDEQYLVTAGSSGEGRRPLVSYTGTLRFTVSNQGNRIAMQAVPGALGEDPVVTASFKGVADDSVELVAQPAPSPTPTVGFDDSLDAIDEIEVGIPYVMGTFGGEPFALSTNPAVAMFPSPDGQSVAWFEVALGARGAMTLHIDSGGTTIVTRPFVVSAELQSAYFPFFDQYSRSHDFWSPSSNIFVFAGRPAGTNETDGIWIVDRFSGSVTRIADGTVASFTRTPQAGGAASAL